MSEIEPQHRTFGRKLSLYALSLAVACVTLAACLVALELFFRLESPQITDHDRMFQPDARLGWTFVANKAGTITYPGESPSLAHTNTQGFRDREFSLVRGQEKTMYVLGDSFVSNLGVGDDEVFTRVMERILPGTSVMNLGVNGYNTVQEWLLLEQMLGRFVPDVVVLVVYVENDFVENTGQPWLFPRPCATLDETGSGLSIHLLTGPPPAARPPTGFRAFFERFHTVHFVRDRWRNLSHRFQTAETRRQPSEGTPPEIYLCRKILSGRTEVMVKVTGLLLGKIVDLCRAHDVSLVLVVAPSSLQVEPERWAELVREYDIPADEIDPAGIDRRIVEIGTQLGVPTLDLLPVLREESGKGRSLYHPHEMHWNREGNVVVANALAGFLTAQKLLMSPGSPRADQAPITTRSSTSAPQL